MTGRPTRGARARALSAAIVTGALAVTLSGCGDQFFGAPDAQPTAAGPTTQPAPTTQAPTPTPTATTTPSPHATPDPTDEATAEPSYAFTAVPKDTPTTTATPTPTQTPSSPSPTSSASPTQAPTQTPTPTPTRTNLQYGDRGDRVLKMQQRLSELGYWLGTPDGHFGGLTQQAVWAFQKAAGLGRDGVVGPKTLAALDAGVRPKSRNGGTGVEIDISRQLLLIVRDGSVVRILNTSTGNGQPYVSRGTEKIARTPTGSFAVYHQVNATEDAELGILYRPKYFYRGWAVHGSSSIPPWPASHGCARVSNAAMNMIWDNGYLAMGTRVNVYR